MKDLGKADPAGVTAPDGRLAHWDKGFVPFRCLCPPWGSCFLPLFADEETEAQHSDLPKGRGLDCAQGFRRDGPHRITLPCKQPAHGHKAKQ